MTVEAAHHTTAIASREITPTIPAPQEIYQSSEQSETQEYDYPFQRRIESQWANLLGEDFTPATNVDVFRDKVDQLFQISTVPQLASSEDYLRKLAYIKIAAISLATSYNQGIAGPVEKKLLDVIPEKYSPVAFTELRLQGVPIHEIRARLKSLHENGESYTVQGIEIPEDEQEARKSRYDLSEDVYQPILDDWQRAAYGTALPEHDCMGVVLDEARELVDEFNNEDAEMSKEEINAISDEGKLSQIMGEVADVVISVDGVFAAEDEDVDKWQNFALDRMIDTYGDVPKLRRMGVPTQVAMEYLSECRYRDDNGLKRPIPPVAIYKGPIFRISTKAPLEPNFSSEVIH